MWGWISYDPELDLIYHGTGNPRPRNSAQRPGDNKWTGATVPHMPSSSGSLAGGGFVGAMA